MDEGRSVVDRTRTATEQYATEIAKLNNLLAAGAIDQQTYTRAVEEANDRALRSSQAWTDGATRFLKDYVAESQDVASATERAFASFLGRGGRPDRLRHDRQARDQGPSGQRARRHHSHGGAPDDHGADRGAAAGHLHQRRFGLFHEGGVVGERALGGRYADPGIFDHAPRYHGGGFAGSGILPDEVPIIARRGELVVAPERVVKERK
jgi:Lambda phage tail tape-measure protein (Tape_meas_lam_C)